MRWRRPLIAALGMGVVLLLAGRAFAFLYTERAWYAALGASDVWVEYVADAALLHAVGFVAAAAFAFANLSAVRHSILSLVLPRRLGNVEIAEAISPRRLDLVALVIALIIAALAVSAIPDWPNLALIRADVRFNETDPYHQLDLAYYTTWLPLELEAHHWAWIVVLLTSACVVALYALTPGLRWHNGMVRMTAYVRRHLATLASIMLLLLAWRARLRTFTLLFDGSGPDGAFTSVDHRWLLPAYVLLGIGTVAGVALFLWSAWTRQSPLSFAAAAGIFLLWLSIHQLLPIIALPPAPDTSAAARTEDPYVATREAFTRRAFGQGVGAGEREHPGVVLSRTPEVAARARLANVAPGARGYLIVRGAGGAAAPVLASFTSRLAHAWSQQDARLLRDLPADARILRVRDVAARVRRIAPAFAQDSRPAALFRADTLYWMTDLYSSSSTYPLSRRFIIAGERRGYFRHAGTAYTNGLTGAVTVIAAPALDPIARAWQRRFPRVFRDPSGTPEWIAELALEPSAPIRVVPGARDSTFRAQALALYLRMRAALSRSDLTTFGASFDSLGALLGP